jgi:hypothetical protein
VRKNSRLFISTMMLLISLFAYSQQSREIKLNPEKVKQFTPYMEFKHGGPEGYPIWKENNKMLYAKEMWYYSESFYVKRNYSPEGVPLNEEIIDISRFENYRKPNQEVIVPMPGFKDALVLIPGSQLIYKP